MSTNLTFFSIIFSIFIIAFVCFLIIKKKIRVKYGLVWIFLFFILFLALVIPGFLDNITNFFGFQTASNLVICIIIGVLIIINIVLTVVISTQNKNIRKLIQELAILKKDSNKK